MRRSILIVGVLLAIILFFHTGYSWARCNQSDLQGTWHFYLTGSGEDIEGAFNYWVYAKVRIRSSGNVRSGTILKTNDGGSDTITGGKITLTRGCVIRGNIELESGAEISISKGALTKDKLYFTGVVHTTSDEGRPEIGLFTAVKK